MTEAAVQDPWDYPDDERVSGGVGKWTTSVGDDVLVFVRGSRRIELDDGTTTIRYLVERRDKDEPEPIDTAGDRVELI